MCKGGMEFGLRAVESRLAGDEDTCCESDIVKEI